MSDKRTQISFTVNKKTLEVLEQLKEAFEVDTNTAALRRALAIARIAAENQRDDHTVTITGKEEKSRDFVLNG